MSRLNTRGPNTRGRAGSQVVNITTLGQRGSRRPGRDIGVGGALVIGLGLLFLYGIISLLFHLVAATILWLPAILAAAYVSAHAGRRGLVGLPRLALGIVVLVAVHVALIAIF